eukprot:CAMPEP_0198246642 /NCGR_PEP_ID=MMETSP1446-20131203/46078_1 /TAXON_ID=1461542 ORGANISM="Unidentified sp, Strain CCMP2111" /NCGR_SAMPLE_ID=MMETSP1446 /ASSEMBLY_ACC=CAM_ASM_001112 /LENGTH=110 /DNA_ID=CAMNT_0043930965 /DNA_START=776 /DNA_END=1108 /DNA_ORIENTATION=+
MEGHLALLIGQVALPPAMGIVDGINGVVRLAQGHVEPFIHPKHEDHKSRNPNGNGQCPVLRWMVCDSYGMEGVVRDVGPEDVENCRDYEECDGCVGEDEHPSQFATRQAQ